MNRNNAVLPGSTPPPAPKEPYNFDPMRYTVQAPIWWCFWRSLLWGVSGFVIPVMAGWFVANLDQDPPGMWKWVLWSAAALFLVGFIATAVRTFSQDQERAFNIMERVTGRDLNGDGTIGGPRPGTPERRYLTPVYVHDDPENRLNNRRVDVETPRDDTLQRMAVILAARGWQYFTADNFTSSKSQTQLMSYDYWQQTFFPSLERARMVSTTTDRLGRKRVELTEMGKQMMLKLAGAIRQEPMPYPGEAVA